MTCTCHDPTVFGHACTSRSTEETHRYAYGNYYRLIEAMQPSDPASTLAQLARRVAETTQKLEKLTQTTRQTTQALRNLPEPPRDDQDLRDYLHSTFSTRSPGATRWVMHPGWHSQILSCFFQDRVAYTTLSDRHDYLFGMPIDIRDDGGPPHLE